MTTTPMVWKAEFIANAGLTTGAQLATVTIGLADGRFLTAWVDDSNNVDGDPGQDIIGRIYDAEGNSVGGAFQLNVFSTSHHEWDFAITALPDGGFAVVYEDNGFSSSASIRFDRFNAAGTHTAGGTIVAGPDTSNPSVAVFANGDFVVTYDQGGADVFAKPVANNMVFGGTFNAAENGADPNRRADTVVLSNGNILSAYEDTHAGMVGIEAKIIAAAGANVITIPIAATGTDPHAATLAGGGFVVVWQDPANNGDIRAEIRDNAGAAVPLSLLVQGGPNNQDQPDVVALKDGGFFVVWNDATAAVLRGQRFSAAGVAIGTTFAIGGSSFSEVELGLTDDGRILVTSDKSGDISQVILDPRDNVINGDATSETITSRIDGATVNGNAGSDTLLGQAAADVLNGGTGVDVLKGRGSNDIYHVDNAGDVVSEVGGTGTDTVVSSISFSLADVVHAIGAIDNVQLANVAAAVNATGNSLANAITGNNFNNTLNGGIGNDVLTASNGNDVLNGSLGADLLKGGAGSDSYYVDNGGDTVSEAGGNGIDTVVSSFSFSLANTARVIGAVENLTLLNVSAARSGTGNGFNNVISGNSFANTLTGGIGNDALRGFNGNDVLTGDHGVDVLNGGANNDILTGGVGIDTLTGGAQNDVFVFNAPLNIAHRDVIADFFNVVGNNDTVRLENAVMTKVGPVGALKPNAFFAGPAAHDADDRIVYNKANGALYYDFNGNAAGGSTLLAVITSKPTLTAGDFVVI